MPGHTSSEHILRFFAGQDVRLCTCRDRVEKSGVTLKAIAEFAPDLVMFHNFDIETEVDVIERGIPAAKVTHDNNYVCVRAHGFELLSGRTCDRPIGVHCLLRCGGLGRDRDGRMRFHSLALKRRGLKHLTTFAFVLTPSDYIRTQLIINGLDAGRVHALPPLLNIASSTANGPGDGNTILFCGRIDRGKGLDMLLEAVRHVRRPYKLRVIGDGRDLDKYKRLAQKRGLAQSTTFLGRLYGRDVENEYRNAAIIALPSRMPEAFCFSGFEALAWGKPVVAFRIGAIEEWLTEGLSGYLVERGDTRRFGQKLDELLGSAKMRERMGRAAQDSLRSYSIAARGPTLSEKFRGLVDGAG